MFWSTPTKRWPWRRLIAAMSLFQAGVRAGAGITAGGRRLASTLRLGPFTEVDDGLRRRRLDAECRERLALGIVGGRATSPQSPRQSGPPRGRAARSSVLPQALSDADHRQGCDEHGERGYRRRQPRERGGRPRGRAGEPALRGIQLCSEVLAEGSVPSSALARTRPSRSRGRSPSLCSRSVITAFSARYAENAVRSRAIAAAVPIPGASAPSSCGGPPRQSPSSLIAARKSSRSVSSLPPVDEDQVLVALRARQQDASRRQDLERVGVPARRRERVLLVQHTRRMPSR